MKTIFCLLCGIVILPSEAHAYLDAGTGGMLLQLLLGGFAIAGAGVKIYWNKITSCFKRK